jgi:hypothetical protein
MKSLRLFAGLLAGVALLSEPINVNIENIDYFNDGAKFTPKRKKLKKREKGKRK